MDRNQIAAVQTIAETRMKAKAIGRTDNQKKVWEYFTGLVGSGYKISDYTYDEMVKQKVQALDYKQRAMEFCGIEEAQVQEVTPVNIESYEFEGNDVLYKIGDDGECRTSAYSIAWIFGGLKQLYVYKYTFNMHTFEKEESCDEYFYKDITNLVISAEVNEKVRKGRVWPLIVGILLLVYGLWEIIRSFAIFSWGAILGYSTGVFALLLGIALIVVGIFLIKKKYKRPEVTYAVYDKFQIFVKGGVSFTASMKASDNTERSINGLKNKWREKKNM